MSQVSDGAEARHPRALSPGIAGNLIRIQEPH